jgi:hypothetical protein
MEKPPTISKSDTERLSPRLPDFGDLAPMAMEEIDRDYMELVKKKWAERDRQAQPDSAD